MEAPTRDPTDDAIGRLQGARPTVPDSQTEAALARLRSVLFGATPRHPVLARYPIVRRLGEGGAGVVYLAHDVELDRPVAVKFISAVGECASAGGSTSRERLRHEAEAIARAPHPNILAIYDVGTATDEAGEPCTFLVLEYVEGADLRTWLETDHGWRATLEIFVAAGRGLAAAHAAGVTHRDFKPANVMVGNDGRVRVLDFGLARTGATRDVRRVTLDDAVTDVHLTEDGTVLGTPAYMAPEQHAGGLATAASDQYGFCVALWEGLLGARPFAGQSLGQLAEAKRDGVPARPRSSPVPARIVRALRRGLEPSPSRRFASMNDLLAALVFVPARRGRLVASIATCAVISIGAVAWTDRDRRCADVDGQSLAAAGGVRRAAIEAAFASTPGEFAADALTRLGHRIERFDDAWRNGYRELCAAGPSQRGADAFDRSMACLRRQRHDADAVLSVLAQADATVVARALEVAGALPDPSSCSDPAHVYAEVAPPTDPQVAGRVAELRSELARILALDAAGRVPDALLAAQSAADEAATLEYPPLLAESLDALGRAQERTGEYELAAATLETAQTLAVSCNHERIAARAAERLVFVTGHRLGELDRALHWASLAAVASERLGYVADPAALPLALASAYNRAGRLGDAQAVGREALAAQMSLETVDAGRLGMLHNNLGDVLRALGDLDGASEHLEAARSLFEQQYGPDHPWIADALNNLGTVDLARRDTEAAEAKFRRVVELRSRVLGSDHPQLMTSLANLANALRRNEKYAEARVTLDHALEILRSHGASETAPAVLVLVALGRLDSAQGDERAALDSFDSAVSIAESTLPASHPDTAGALVIRATTKMRLGDLDGAFHDFDAGIAISRAVYGAGHAKVATSRLRFAEDLDERGHSARAIAVATEARAALTNQAAPVGAELEAWLAGHTEMVTR